MKSKYASVQPDYKNTIALLVRETGWSAETTENVVGLLMQASGEKAASVVEEKRREEKNAKYLVTKKLLKNYRLMRKSIESGTEHTLKLLEDAEFQRLMELEESVRNQDLRSVALQTAANKVLWARVNAALDCFKETCKNASAKRIQRQYDLIFMRYLSPQKCPIAKILSKHHIEQAEYFRNIKEAISVLLFGAENAEDFIAGQNNFRG